MARLARRRVIVRSDTYSSSSHLQLSSCKSVGSLYSSISLRHRVAATTRQLATTRSPIRMSRRWSHHLSFSHQSPVSDDTDYFIRAPGTVSNVLSGWISSQFSFVLSDDRQDVLACFYVHNGKVHKLGRNADGDLSKAISSQEMRLTGPQAGRLTNWNYRNRRHKNSG